MLNTKIKIWETPNPGEEKGVIFVIHGMGEYHKRYDDFGKYISKKGYKVAMIDHKGHGINIESMDKLGFIDDNFQSSLEEIKSAIEKVREENQEIPLFILGHSMGSFMTQILFEDGVKAQGIILSGSVRPFKISIKFAYTLASFLLLFRNKRSYMFDKIVFGLNNIKFKGKSKFRWLTRDEKSIEEFEKDPLCGCVPYTSYYRGLFYMIGKTIDVGEKEKNIETPMYIFSGSDDPVGEYGVGTKKLYKFYKKLGYKDIELKIYPSGRHEMLNEINRKEVYDNLLKWLIRRS